MAIIKSFDPLAKASATSIVFKQKNNEKEPFARQEIIALIAQPQTGKTGVVFNQPILASGVAEDEGVRYGFGSPIHLAIKKLFPRDGNGARVPVYIVPVEDDVSAVASTGSIVFSGTANKTFNISLRYNETELEAGADACGKIATNAQLNPARAPRGINLNGFRTLQINVLVAKSTDDDSLCDLVIAKLDELSDVPFTFEKGTDSAGDPQITFTAKWKGADANKIKLSVVDPDENEITVAGYGMDITASGMSGGAGVSSIATALDNLVAEFEVTRLITQFYDESSLDLIKDWAMAFRTGQISQFAVAYHGYEFPESEVVAGTIDTTALISLADGRADDSVNIMIGGNFGNDIRPLTYSQRDLLLKKGITNVVKTRLGSYRLWDCATFFHQAGVQNSIFAFDRDICVIGNIAYDQRQVFEKGEDWRSVILISSEDVTDNPDARSVLDIKGAVNSRIDRYGLSAWLTDIENTKENTVVEIDSNNPNRVNINIFGALSGVLRIGDITNSLGFFFGS